MIIILGSKNPSKKRSLENALIKLGIKDFEIITNDSQSGVNSKPIGYEIIRGALNRNQESKAYALNNNITYDYLCAIEGGFSVDENGTPYVVTYAIIENINDKKSTGKSLGIRLRKDVFNYLKNGGSFNKLISHLNNGENYKHNQGITGYLSNGIYSRDRVDEDAVISAFIPFIFKEQRDFITERIKEVEKNN